MAAPSGTGGTPAVVMDGGGAAYVRRASSRRYLVGRFVSSVRTQGRAKMVDLYAAMRLAQRMANVRFCR